MFDCMPERNVVSWSGMIAGYDLNGQDEEALKVFCQALMMGLRPNYFIFSTVLSVCVNITALDHGRKVHFLSINIDLIHTLLWEVLWLACMKNVGV